MKSIQRQSSFELLRILSMLMVLIVHIDGASLGLPSPSGDITEIASRDWWRIIVESFTIIGVNCFSLISGYFGIKASWRGALKFSATCLFYSVGVYVCFAAAGLTLWRWSKFADALMIFSHTDLWYVPAYLGLYIISPLLNAGVEILSRRKLVFVVLAIVAFNLYFGWWWGASFNPTGYTIAQLVMMYMVGRYIGRYGLFSNDVRPRIYAIMFFVATGAIVVQSLYCDVLWTFAYNSPFVMISSVAFFMCIGSLKINSRAINTLATSAFAVYLLHKNPYIWINFVKPATVHLWQELSLGLFSVYVIASVVAIYSLTFLIDRLRIYLVSKL